MRRHLVATAAALSFAGLTQPALSDAFSASDIRSDIIGHTIYLAAPFGGEFPLNYRPNGQVDGNGEALGIGRWIQPRDTGRWWIDGNRLCQQFQSWYNGTPMCFDLTRTSTTTLNWLRDNGERGRARIGEAL